MAKKKRGRKPNKRKNLKFIYIIIIIVVVVFTCYYFKDEIIDTISQIINNTSNDDSSSNDISSSEERETTTTLVNTRFKNTISNWSFSNNDIKEATPSFNENGEFKFENLNDKLKSPSFSSVDEITITLFISSFTNNINTTASDKNYIFLINGFNESNEVVATIKVDSLTLNENIFTLKGNKISYIEISMDGYYLINDAKQTISLQSINVKCDSSLITSGIVENYTYDNLQIYFLELGSYKTGDSVFIKVNDIDILIDAGSETTSVPTLVEFINKHCTDNKLEYVITTHAHSDHYSGMFGSNKNGIMYQYKIDTIIDFALSNDTERSQYKKYQDAVNYAISNGAKRFSAADCFYEKNGASKSYYLDEVNNISLDILYNKYYFEKSSDENNYSVCSMINYNDKHFMFTGDLEKDGEEEMAKYYDKSSSLKTLPHVDLFKAGHHGSATSSNEALLDLITPEICCVCCCAGSSEYTNANNNIFPTQDFINRIAKYTDRVYVTSVLKEKETRENDDFIFTSLNGTICISSNGSLVGINATNNVTKLKDSTWFNEKIYVIDGKVCTGKGKKDFYNENDKNASLITRRTWPEYL
ncbi:MAG: MBL fold metallo-hydrolase [Candidatus Caccosoma sp.]|nr:MBL fold metallo-hydrolase [Candidatus Caccosoma sp.]